MAGPKGKFIVAENPTTPPFGPEGAVYAIGNFDGVHCGHLAVLERAKALAARLRLPVAALTFEPHPVDHFVGKPVVFRLTDAGLKSDALRAAGLDGSVTLTFDATLAGVTATEFLDDVLGRRLGAKGVVIGWDFHFGRDRGGTPAFLVEEGARRRLAVEIVARVDDADAGAFSSTAARKALEAGDVAAAARILGRAYRVRGEVVSGRKLGRTLGVPTANVVLPASNRLKHGVYAVETLIDGMRRGGVASFGTRPTVDDGAPLLETFVFDFDGDLYGRTIEVGFLAWLRDEMKFNSLEGLQSAMAADIAEAKAIWAKR